MMIYFDTNVLVYSVINQDADKMLISQNLIKRCPTLKQSAK